MPEEGIALRDKAEFMSSEETIAIAKQFVELGVKKIRLTGGEPLIKKDIVNILTQLGELPIELTMTTNAILVDRYIEDFKNVGITSMNVSLDSLKEERFNMISRRNYFERILKNIQLLIDEGFRTKVNVVLIKGTNDDEIIDFIEWTKDKKIQVRFIEFMPFDGNNWNWEKKVSLKEILEKVEAKYGKEDLIQLEARPNDTTKNFKISGFSGSFGVISSVTNPFCDSCNRIRLTADGKIKNCLFSSDETDLLTAFRAGNEITSLIYDSISKKKKSRAGIESFENKESAKVHEANRSMIAIGG
jgi:molybdenum cofactor biosynthesis protein A